ncbi:NAD(P)-dependent alcohol dehydrogenase [Pendulispora brunnea]|uniref:NAD(P)-dependent alcohol dehydrogenase n=1 Tax=Pendulispora brunnea TaxID=2905690 RepID=A0ABZ2K4U2_9BACT
MLKTPAYAAARAGAKLAPTIIERRDPGPKDVLLEILYSGICHSDLHQARDEWGGAIFPMVPGHEIVGRVTQVGKDVTKFKVGDIGAVGCFVDSCGTCASCKEHLENFCEAGCAYTYNSTEMDRKTPTYGGYSSQIVVREHYTLKVPAGLDLAATAPLLCAGITTYSPLRQFNCKKGDRVAVVGLGGLGHMAVKFAASMGAEVTVLSTSRAKEADAKRLGAHAFEVTSDKGVFPKLANRFHLIVDTVSAPHDLNDYFETLHHYGTLALVGLPPEALRVEPFALVSGNRRFAGSNIGGIKETQEMLDYCAAHGIVSDIETIDVHQVNEAYERLLKNDVRYRFVIDGTSLRA